MFYALHPYFPRPPKTDISERGPIVIAILGTNAALCFSRYVEFLGNNRRRFLFFFFYSSFFYSLVSLHLPTADV